MKNYQVMIIDKNMFNGTILTIKAKNEEEVKEKIKVNFPLYKIDKITELKKLRR